MYVKHFWFVILTFLVLRRGCAQSAAAASAAGASTGAEPRVGEDSIDDAIQMALQHNHSLLAARTQFSKTKPRKLRRTCARIP